jgi:hypothetical protein
VRTVFENQLYGSEATMGAQARTDNMVIPSIFYTFEEGNQDKL